MQIEERAVGDVIILDLTGRLILGEGDQPLKDKINALVHKGHKRLLLNLEGVTFLDSAGVGALVWKYVTMKKMGGALKLLNLTKRSHGIMAVTKLVTVFETFDSEEVALRSFSQPERSDTADTAEC